MKKSASPFLLPNDPLLLTIATEIPITQIQSTEIKQSIQQMVSIALGEQGDRTKPLLVGLAAPQIGISQRIILVDIKADGKGEVGDLRVFINPEIIEKSEEENEWYEGCFSTDCVCGIVSRPSRICLKAYGPSGEMINEVFEGYIARIFQHEIDHLDGKEFTTHIVDDAKLHWVEKEQFAHYRNNQAWKHWPYLCSREKWNHIKGVS